MATPDTGGLNVAAELAALRGSMETGFAKLEGAITALTQSVNHTRDDLEDLESELDQLAGRVLALEARRFPLAPVAALAGVVSAATAAVALFVR